MTNIGALRFVSTLDLYGGKEKELFVLFAVDREIVKNSTTKNAINVR